MAFAENSSLAATLRGSIGKELVFRQWEDKTVVAKSPKTREGEPHPVQAAKQEKFLAASRYAKAVMNDPGQELADAYREVLKPRQNLYCRASEDFLSPPVVRHIKKEQYHGVAGDRIIVRAKDDFRVVRVWVEIIGSDGTQLEAGNAIQNLNGLDWTYSATKNHAAAGEISGCRIKAFAVDVPGNVGTLEEMI
jgi:hypothetical protein